MKKNKFRFLLCLAVLALSLTSCNTTNPYAEDPRYPIYQLAVDSGFTGTYEEWLESIRGEDGQNGETPHIGENGNWWIGDTDTGVPATGPQGPAGSDGQPGSQGSEGPQGPQGEPGKNGQDGQTPYIGENGNWWIGDTDTGVPATGPQGPTGDTGPQGPAGSDGAPGSQGEPGKDGNTPYIGENGNWWIGDIDTGVPATGKDGQDGAPGSQGEPGKDGNSVLTGYDAPTPDLGKVGDIYIDVGTWDYYVKTANGWIKMGNIKGQPGQDGKDGQDGSQGPQGEPGKDGQDGKDGIDGQDGTSMHTGHGVPGDDFGLVGDSYVDLDTWNFYVKTENGWVLEGNIKGNNGSDYERETHIITFETLGGSYVEPQEVIHGEKITKPTNPTKIGSEFVRWEYLGEPWVFHGYVVTEDMTLTAVWDNIEYTATFVNDNGDILDYQEGLYYGDAIVYHGYTPEKQNKEDHYTYTFTGWDKDLIVTGDMVFTAQYRAEYAPFTAIYINYDGTELYRTFFKEGETATYAGDTPTRANEGDTQYNFNSWEEISNDGETIIYQAKYDGCTAGLIFEENSVYQYVGSSNVVYIPSFWNGKTITTISDYAFEDTSVREVYLPDSVTSIGKAAFCYCDSLTSIIIPDSVTSIGDWAFSNCSSLTSVIIPDSVTSIGDWAFYNCYSLTSVILGNSVTSIGYEAFSSCSSLTSIIIPDSVTSIGERAFFACRSLTSVTLENSVKSIGDWAFYNCSSLTSIIIPDSVNSIGYRAFHECSSLTIFCEAESQPSGWDDYWNYSNRPVYWAGEWEYDAGGNPTPII